MRDSFPNSADGQIELRHVKSNSVQLTKARSGSHKTYAGSIPNRICPPESAFASQSLTVLYTALPSARCTMNTATQERVLLADSAAWTSGIALPKFVQNPKVFKNVYTLLQPCLPCRVLITAGPTNIRFYPPGSQHSFTASTCRSDRGSVCRLLITWQLRKSAMIARQALPLQCRPCIQSKLDSTPFARQNRCYGRSAAFRGRYRGRRRPANTRETLFQIPSSGQ